MKSLNKRRVVGVFSILVFLLFFIFSNASQGMQVYQETDFVTGIVTAKKLNVRQGPGLKYKVVTQIQKNDYVRVFAQIGKWYIVQTDKDYIGAVSKDYIKAVHSTDNNEASTEEHSKNDENINSTDQNTNEEQNVQNTDETNKEDKQQKTEDTTKEDSNDSVGLEEEAVLTEVEKEMFNIINEKRKEAGLSELLLDEEIQNVARVKAREMEEANYFSHTSPTYGGTLDMLNSFGIKYKVSGENIAGNSTAQGAVEAWMASDGHKVNILSNSYNYTGIGVANSKKYGKIFVQIFVGK